MAANLRGAYGKDGISRVARPFDTSNKREKYMQPRIKIKAVTRETDSAVELAQLAKKR